MRVGKQEVGQAVIASARTRTWALRLAALLMMLGAWSVSARAAYPPPPSCPRTGWWSLSSTLTSLQWMPVSPWVLLPIEWVPLRPDAQSWSSEMVSPNTLSVEVRDEVGTLVAGELQIRSPGSSLAFLAKSPWWRPDEPLAPDTRYTVTIVVFGPSENTVENPGRLQCNFSGFTTAFDFTTRGEDYPRPELVVEYRTEDNDTPWQDDYGWCTGAANERWCETNRSICCIDPPTIVRAHKLSVTTRNLSGWSASYAVIARSDSSVSSAWDLRAALEDETGGLQLITYAAAAGPELDADTCVVVDLRSYIVDGIVATQRVCAKPEDHVALGPRTSPFACKEWMCERAAGNPGPTPTEPVDGGGSTDPGSCASGEVGLAHVVAGLLLLRLRRWRDSSL